MLQEFTNKYQRKMWKSMISRKKLDLNIWDLIAYKNEKVYYMPYNNYMKFEINTRHCLKCNTELEIGFRKNEFISGPCVCSMDGKNHATLQKLSSVFPEAVATVILKKFADAKTRKLKNRKKYWLDLGYTIEEADTEVLKIQKLRSSKSPASKQGSREHSVRCKEYWMKQGLSETLAIKKVSESQVTNGLDWYIVKYGMVAGTAKYNKRIASWLSKMSKLSLGVSVVSVKLFELVDPVHNGAYGKYETTVRGYDKVYRVDYFDRQQRKIIEFDGDYWHANPLIYKPTDKIRNKLAEDIWQLDINKTINLEKAGYSVLRISEYDFVNFQEKSVNKCKEFLNAD